MQPVQKKRRKSGLLKKVEAELAAERAAAAAETASPAPQQADRPVKKQPADRARKAARASAGSDGGAGPSSEPTAASGATTAGTAAGLGRQARQHANGAVASAADEVALKRKKKQRKGAEVVQDLDAAGDGAANAEVSGVQRDAGETRGSRPSNGSIVASQRPKKGEGKGGGEAAAQAALKRKISKMKAHQGVKR